MTDFKENTEIYCRRLGRKVAFSYCANEGMNKPCRIIYQCWEGRMSIRDYLNNNYSKEQLSKLNIPPQPQIASIVDCIEKARNTSDTQQVN